MTEEKHLFVEDDIMARDSIKNLTEEELLKEHPSLKGKTHRIETFEIGKVACQRLVNGVIEDMGEYFEDALPNKHKEKKGEAKMKRQICITPDDLIEFMGKMKYVEFIRKTRSRINLHPSDYEKIEKDEPLWIIGEWKGKIHF